MQGYSNFKPLLPPYWIYAVAFGHLILEFQLGHHLHSTACLMVAYGNLCLSIGCTLEMCLERHHYTTSRSSSISQTGKVKLTTNRRRKATQTQATTKMNSLYQICSKMLHSTKVIIFILWHLKKVCIYRTHAIISHVLYFFLPNFNFSCGLYYRQFMY